MKKNIFPVIFALALPCFAFFSCASLPERDGTSLQSSPDSNEASDSKDVKKTSKTKEAGRFDDWKYKGFGMEIPEWVIPALDGKTSEVAKYFPQCDSEKIFVVLESGINVDHSEEKLKSKALAGKLLDGFWVRVNSEVLKTGEPYITVLVFEK